MHVRSRAGRRQSGARHAIVTLATALAVLLGGVVPLSAQGIEPPPELRFVCVDRQGDVAYAATPGACGARESVRTLPDDAPVYWCVDSRGVIEDVPSPGCGRRAQLVTIPDGGPVQVCAANVQGGTTLDRGLLRRVADLSACTRDETGMVTPASPEGVDDAYETDEDTPLVVAPRGVLDNDVDLSGAPLTAELVSGPSTGTLTLASDGALTFDPRGAFDHLDVGVVAEVTFRYRAFDGSLFSEPTTVTIGITGRNDRPIATADAFSTDEDTPIQVVRPGVLGNDHDAESHPLQADEVVAVDRGDAVVDRDGAMRFLPGRSFQHLGDGEEATATLRYVARDGSSASDETAVVVTVVGRNDVPVPGDDAFTTDENTAITLSPDDLLGNDADAEGDHLRVVDVGAVDPPGTVAPDGNGGVVVDPEVALDGLASGQTGLVSFTYRADDGTGVSAPATVRVSITGISPPVARADTATTDEDTAVAIDLLANDDPHGASPELDTTGVAAAITRTGDGVVVVDPSAFHDRLRPGEEATISFPYTLTNEEGSSDATVQVRVTGDNDAPVAVDDSFEVDSTQPVTVDPPGVLRNASDPEGDPLQAVLVSPPAVGRLTLAAHGGFTYDPAGEYTGEDPVTFRYRASDGERHSASALITLDVEINQPPSLGDAAFSIVADGTVGQDVGGLEASDPDGDPVDFALEGADAANFALTPDPDEGANARRLVVDVADIEPRLHRLTVRVSDDRGGTATATVEVDVVAGFEVGADRYRVPANTELVAGRDLEGEAGRRFADGVLANDRGTTGVQVRPDSGRTTAGGTYEIEPDGSFRYRSPRPSAAGNGTCPSSTWDGSTPLADSFEYTVERGGEVVGEHTVEVTVPVVVWYVDADASTDGCGTSQDPYRSVSSLSGSVDDDAQGQSIVVMSSASPQRDALVLEPRQQLVGQAAGFTFEGELIVPLGPTPVLAPTTGTALRLASDNVVRGLDIDAGGTGIDGAGAVGDVAITDVDVTAVGDAVRLHGATAGADVQFDAVRSTGPDATALTTTGQAGDVSAATVDASGASSALDTLDLSGGSVTIGSLTAGATRGARVDVSGSGPETWVGSVTIGHIDAVGSDAALDVANAHSDENRDEAGVVTAPQVTATGVASAVVVGGGGFVDIGRLDVTDPTGAALQLRGTTGQVQVLQGALTAGPPFAGELVDVEGHGGVLDLGASVALAGPTPGGEAASGRTVGFDDLRAGSRVVLRRAVTDYGAGIAIEDAASGSSVALLGDLIASTRGTAALSATGDGSLEVAGPTTRLTATGAPGLVLDGTTFGSRGVQFDRIDVTAPGNGPAIAVTGTEGTPNATGRSQLRISGGTLAGGDDRGVAVDDSADVLLGGLLVERSGLNGVDVTDSERVTLQGLTVERAEGHGIHLQRSGEITVDGTTSANAGVNALRISDPQGRTGLTNTTLRAALATQLVVTDASTPAGLQDEVTASGLVVADSAEEVDGIDVTASGTSTLAFRFVPGSPSGIIGGRDGFRGGTSEHAQLDVELAQLTVGAVTRDGISLEATAADAASPSRLTFDLHDIDPASNGGLQLPGGAGIRIHGDGAAQVTGSIESTHIAGSTGPGLALEHVQGVDLALLTVSNVGRGGSGEDGEDGDDHAVEPIPANAIDIRHADGLTLDQVVVDEAVGHGLFAWGVTDLRVDDSRFDLRTDRDTAADPALYAGIMARYLGGTSGVTDTTVRGATLHGITAVNGATFPTIADPAELSATPGDVPTTASLDLSGLTVLDNGVVAEPPDPDSFPIWDPRARELRGIAAEHARDAVLVGAASGSSIAVDLDGRASTVDRPIRIEAIDGEVSVSGGHDLQHVGDTTDPTYGLGVGDALQIRATVPGDPAEPADATSHSSVALTGMNVTFALADEERTAGRGVLVEGNDIDRVSVASATIDAAGDGIVLDRSSRRVDLPAGTVACVDLTGNDTEAVTGTGYLLRDVDLLDLEGTVGDWLTARGNTGPAEPRFVTAFGTRSCQEAQP